MGSKQKTIQKEFSLSGVGLHTGHKVEITFKPAPENSGIRFIRVDLPGSPVIRSQPSSVVTENRLPRCTSIRNGEAVIHTVEHLMSVLCGLEIDNLDVEVNGDEMPGLDGSGIVYLNEIKKAGLKEQSVPRACFSVREPVGVERNGSSIFVLPAEDFKVSYTLDYDHPVLRSQFFSSPVNAEIFEKEIAPSRTFCLEKEAEELRKIGLGLGANFENTLVVGDTGVKNNKVRFENEFARHKTLDFIGDLYLLGMPIRGHVFAVKSGHSLNLELLKKIERQYKQQSDNKFTPGYPVEEGREIGIEEIMRILPHRYPFLLVDRITKLEKGRSAVGIKNVTMNEDFFRGHFPDRPIMPGVLMIEAMAQTAGIAILTDEKNRGKIAFFMGADKVKFRKVVSPGDQLVMDVKIVRDRSRTALIEGQAKVNGEVVAEAEMLFSFADASYLT